MQHHLPFDDQYFQLPSLALKFIQQRYVNLSEQFAPMMIDIYPFEAGGG